MRIFRWFILPILVILLSLFWSKMSRMGALTGMAAGALTVLFWLTAPLQINGNSLSATIYELVPGFIIAALVAVLVSLLTQPKQKFLDAHQAVVRLL